MRFRRFCANLEPNWVATTVHLPALGCSSATYPAARIPHFGFNTMKPLSLTDERAAVAFAAWNVEASAWEELPSMLDAFDERLESLGLGATHRREPDGWDTSADAWVATHHAPLEPDRAPTPSLELVHGVITRELTEPEVFRHFFGRSRG